MLNLRKHSQAAACKGGDIRAYCMARQEAVEEKSGKTVEGCRCQTPATISRALDVGEWSKCSDISAWVGVGHRMAI